MEENKQISCPKCGSRNFEVLETQRIKIKFWKKLLIVIGNFLLFGILLSIVNATKSEAAYYVAAIVTLVAILTSIIICKHYENKGHVVFVCKDCGTTFIKKK